MITTIAPQTLLLGLWLVCTLLALCGKLPLLTSVLSGTSAFFLLVYHLTVPQHIAIIVSVLLWFILWRLGTAIHRHSKKKSQAATQQKRPDPMVQSTHQPAKQTAPIAKRGHPTAKASARIATAEVNALVDQTVEIAGWMLDAGHGASLVTNAAYEGAILVTPLQEKNSPRWQMALMMLSTPDLAQAQQSFLARNANTVRQHPEIFSPLCWFTENYRQNYIPEDKRYLLLTKKAPGFLKAAPATICKRCAYRKSSGGAHWPSRVITVFCTPAMFPGNPIQRASCPSLQERSFFSAPGLVRLFNRRTCHPRRNPV